jgi:type IV pilus assembly protein PilE
VAAAAMSARWRSERGFSLVELLIVIVIVGILAAIALPGYQNSVRKTRRSDAKAALLETAQRLERCLTQYGTYDDGNCAVAGGTSPEGYYTIAVQRTATTYTVSATPAGAQAKDTHCAVLALNNLGARSASDADGNPAPACW